MSDFILNVESQLDALKTESGRRHLKTPQVRSLSAALYKELADKSRDNVFAGCSELLDKRVWAMDIIAYDFAYRVRKQYDESTFPIFESWLIKYVRDWSACDDFCSRAFGELLIQRPELFPKIISWTEREEFWVRRASAVVLIPAIRKNKYAEINPLMISDLLMQDGHYLVLKGYGWMLKMLSQKEPEKVSEYLIKHKDIMPRISFRYAVEKMDKAQKEYLMGL